MYLRHFPNEKEYRRLAEHYNVIPVCMEILADTETPITILKKFYRQKKPIFLFESVEGGEKWGRYSFMGISAHSRIKIFNDRMQIEKNGKAKTLNHHGNPIVALRAFMKEFLPPPIFELPRFWGGLVGYLTYEMVSFFEKIPNRLHCERPLAHFIVPDELIIFDNFRNTIFILILSFLEDRQNISRYYQDASKRLGELYAAAMETIPKTETKPSANRYRLTPIIEEETFRNMVNHVKTYIRSGDVIQTVISQPFICDSPPDLLTLYRAQRYVNPSPYLFYMDLGDTALIGSSPETMVRLEDGVATLRPIAGTRHRGAGELEDRALEDELLRDEKERAEHIMLVDLGRNDLGRVARTGSVQVTDVMRMERYSHVMHLVSDIQCNLAPDKDAWDLLEAVFPAGTLTGAPKIRAMQIIDEVEHSPRGPYGGGVGYVSFSGNMDLAITIRTAIVENDRLILRTGAGIVADSDPEKERMETVNKAEAMNKALQLIH